MIEFSHLNKTFVSRAGKVEALKACRELSHYPEA